MDEGYLLSNLICFYNRHFDRKHFTPSKLFPNTLTDKGTNFTNGFTKIVILKNALLFNQKKQTSFFRQRIDKDSSFCFTIFKIMKSDLLPILEYMEREKGICRSDMIASIIDAVQTAAQKSTECQQGIRVEIHPQTGKLLAWAQWKVVDSVTDPQKEIPITIARKTAPYITLGEIFEQPIQPSCLGRIAAQTASQLLNQKVNRFTKQHIYEQFRDRIGTILSGIVRFQERGNITIDFGQAEGTLFRNEAIWCEHFNPGDRIHCLLQGIKETPHGSELMLTRAHPDFVKAMMMCEISELAEGLIEIKTIVRDPGFRTKMCVDTHDARIDPVGACIGSHGSRIKGVLKNLGQEKIDVIRYSDDIRTLVLRVVQPAIPQSLHIDEVNRIIQFSLEEKDFAVFVGKSGRNLKLASRLLGYEIHVQHLQTVGLNFEDKKAQAIQTLMQTLGIAESLAAHLVEKGITDRETLAEASEEDLIAAGISAEEAQKVLAVAKNIHG